MKMIRNDSSAIGVFARRVLAAGALIATGSGCSVAMSGDGDAEAQSAAEALTPGQIDTIRVQVILAAYDDGANAPTVTAEQIRTSLKLATDIYNPVSVRFAFDPETDLVRVKSTLIARECTLAPGAVLGTTTEPACDYDRHLNERKRVAETYPGKLVIIFALRERTYADGNGLWQYGPAGFAWGSGTDPYVNMTTGDPGNDGLAHEMGHYLHLNHTFGAIYTTLSDAQNGIRNYVESNNYPKERGYDLFNGDGLASTPPDPGQELFLAAGLDPCNASQGSLTLPVTFSDRTTTNYVFTPDRENVMDYWDKTCRGKQADLSSDQVNLVREAIDTGNRSHLTAYKQQFSAVFEPGATGQTRAITWAQTDFATRFNQEIAAGKHLVHMQAYDIGGGQIRYDGVWETGNKGTTRAIAWSLADFETRFNTEISAGKHLVHMQAYDIPGQGIRYDGVWETGNKGTHHLFSANFTDFSLRNEQEVASGRRLIKLNEYDIGNGQLRYDGVWEVSTIVQRHIFAESVLQFASAFNAQLSAGRHAVLMHSVLGR